MGFSPRGRGYAQAGKREGARRDRFRLAGRQLTRLSLPPAAAHHSPTAAGGQNVVPTEPESGFPVCCRQPTGLAADQAKPKGLCFLFPCGGLGRCREGQRGERQGGRAPHFAEGGAEADWPGGFWPDSRSLVTDMCGRGGKSPRTSHTETKAGLTHSIRRRQRSGRRHGDSRRAAPRLRHRATKQAGHGGAATITGVCLNAAATRRGSGADVADQRHCSGWIGSATGAKSRGAFSSCSGG